MNSTEQPIRKSWTNWFFILINLGVVSCLLMTYLAAHVPPSTLGYLSLFGLTYPFALAGNFLFVIFWFFKRRKFTWISLTAILIGYSFIGDFFQINWSKPKTELTNQIKVLTYNVRLFDLYNWSKNIEGRNKIFDLLKRENADIMCFQEFYYSSRKGEFETRDTMLQFLPTKYYHERFTHAINGRSYFGVALFSRYPIINKGFIPFESDVNNYCIYADIKCKGDTLRIYDAHLASIRFQKEDYEFVEDIKNNEEIERGSKRIARRLKDAFIKRESQAARIIEHISDSPYKVVLCGDFNDTPVSHCYQKFSEQLLDSFKEAGSGISNTYIGKFPSFRIDYVLHSAGMKAIEYNTLPDKLSDHHALTTVIAF